MSVMEVLLPVFVQVILTFVVAYMLAFRRVTLIRSGALRGKKVSLREPNWPDHVQPDRKQSTSASSNCRSCSMC